MIEQHTAWMAVWPSCGTRSPDQVGPPTARGTIGVIRGWFMRDASTQKMRCACLTLPMVLCLAGSAGSAQPVSSPGTPDFSGSLVRQVNGKRHQAQVFSKGNRLRLEYKYAVRTDHGYAAIEIIRLDLGEAWYVLAQQKELLVMPLNDDDVLPVQSELPGERERVPVGDATAAGRPTRLYEVQTERDGRIERFYEWVDVETGIVLKLVSRDRDWSFEYQRIRLSPQPSFYFDEPPGYRKRVIGTVQKRQG